MSFAHKTIILNTLVLAAHQEGIDIKLTNSSNVYE